MPTRKPEPRSEPLHPERRWAESGKEALVVTEVEPARRWSRRAALGWIKRKPEMLENRRTPPQRQGLCAAASSGICSRPTQAGPAA
jgi:hypothetical protein